MSCPCSCNAYVMAWKRLTVQRAPNILTIALKRFQSGRFGKLNKRVTFPETLDLSSYMSELEDGNNIYKLYAVIVHVDMLNASYFGHYICYVKDFCGNWYRIDDCKVARVDLDEVLSQGAYMLLYSRICARPSCLLPAEALKRRENENVKIQAVDPSLKEPNGRLPTAGCLNSPVDSWHLLSANGSGVEVKCEEDLSSIINADDAGGDAKMVSCEASLPISNVEPHDSEGLSLAPKAVASAVKHTNQPIPASTSLIDNGSTQLHVHDFEPSSPISDVENARRGNKRDANEGLLRMSTEESSAADSCKFEKDNTYDVSPITTVEVREENSANSTSMPENAKCGGNVSLSPDDDTKDAAKKSNGQSSGAKLKPIFAPGFLGKHPRKKFIKRGKVSVELSEVTPKTHLNNERSEVVKPYLSSENGSLLKDEERPCVVFENGMASMQSAARKSLENGDSGHQIACGERTKTNITKERLQVVGQQNHVVDIKSHGLLEVESSNVLTG